MSLFLCATSTTGGKIINKWLKRNIPQWSNFSISDTTKSLGFYVGPAAGRENWIEQAAKIRQRIRFIQAAQAPVKLNTHTFNSRVVPVTSYVAQLLLHPKEFTQLERASVHTVLRLPQNALCHSDFSTLQLVEARELGQSLPHALQLFSGPLPRL